MRVNIREVLDNCIAQGIDTGYHRAYKYTDNPSHAEMMGSIENEIWLEIDRCFDFERNLCDEVVKGFDKLEQKRMADQQIGAWLSAALEDPSTCQSMKDDINEWFKCAPQEGREPVAWIVHEDGVRGLHWRHPRNGMLKAEPLYTAPPKREWVGLTKKEFEDAIDDLYDIEDCWVAIEDKLKEKNT